MTIRTFLNLFLKILGVFVLYDVLGIIPHVLMSFVYLDGSIPLEQGINNIVFTVLAFLAVGAIAWILIFRSNVIIDKLKLDKGFNQENIHISIDRTAILGIAIIVFSGLLLINELPELIRFCVDYYQTKILTYGMARLPSLTGALVPAFKVIFALILIFNQRQVVKYIDKKTNNSDDAVTSS